VRFFNEKYQNMPADLEILVSLEFSDHFAFLLLLTEIHQE
jgi:hypothetical protein